MKSSKANVSRYTKHLTTLVPSFTTSYLVVAENNVTEFQKIKMVKTLFSASL
jgi:hypothetical protein